jgi:hypothetical protein
VSASSSVLRALRKHGLLLKQDKRLPSVVGLVTGESLAMSWWSHPEGRRIFAVLTELADHPDVHFAKLVAGKDTLVHRRLWPALLAVGTSAEPWQRDGLSEPGRKLFASVGRKGSVEARGAAAKELALRLLAVTTERHTESGKHVLVLESWKSWAARNGVKASKTVPEARRALEIAALSLGAPLSALPWAAS